MRPGKSKIIFAAVIFAFYAAFAACEEIEITSDMAEYDKTENRGLFSGNVKIKTASGGVGIDLSCDEARIDSAGKDILLKGAYFTTCDLEHPHYRVYAKNAHLVLNDRMTAENVVFYLGSVPVAYLPYYYKSLKNRPYRLELKPGYNRTNGIFGKGLFGYPISPNFYGKLFLDFYNLKGWGKGGELLYNAPGESNGSFYGYHIKEKDTGKDRWNLRLYHWEALPDGWFTQVNSNFMSDESFTNSYSDDWLRINNDITSSIAFTKNSSQATSRLFFSRQDIFDAAKGKFSPGNITAPSVSYNTSQIKMGRLPLYYSWGTAAARTWDSTTGYYLTNGSGNFNMTSPLSLARGMMLTTGFGLNESWQDRTSKTDAKDVFGTVYQTNVNLKIRSWYVLEHNISHNFVQQIGKKNDDYHGVLTNKITESEWLYLDKISLRAWSGLDIRRKLGENISSYRPRFDDVVSEFDFTPGGFTDYYYRNDYSVALRRVNSHQLSTSNKFYGAGGAENGYLKTGVSYAASSPDSVTLLGEFGVRPDDKWQIAYKVQTSLTAAGRSVSECRVYEQAINVYRDLHCWEADVSYTYRTPDYYEFWFSIRLKPGKKTSSTAYPEDMEKKWYPWR